MGDIPGYQAAMYTATGTREWSAWLTTPANAAAGMPEKPYDLRVFRQGGFDPAAGRAGEPVEVNGKPGFYREDMPCECGFDVRVPSVGWEYAPDSWALVQHPGNSSGSPAGVRGLLMSMATASASTGPPRRGCRSGSGTCRPAWGRSPEASRGEGYTTDELAKVARSIQPVPDVENPNTWLDAEDAIPLR